MINYGELLPKRKTNDNKYSVGTVLAITGSDDMTGAAAFAAKAAVLCGTGLLYQFSSPLALSVLKAKLDEPVFAVSDLENIKKRLDRATAVLFGCGIELCRHNEEILEYIVSEVKSTVVLDASALTLIAKRKDLFAKCKSNIILTPHEGEMTRLIGDFSDRKAAAEAFAASSDAVLVLKGHNTIIAQKDRFEINKTGNAGMAKGGYGDILAGMIASFASQGLSPYDSALLGTYIHGLAGDLTAKKYGMLSAIPSYALKMIPKAILSLDGKDV